MLARHFASEKKIMLWLMVAIIICVEFALFRYKIIKQILPYYPVASDQTSYLTLAYTTYENIKQYGLILGLQKSTISTNGILFPLQAVVSFFILGINRFNALLPNIIYFIGLQWITLYALRSITLKNYAIILMLGLMLAVKSPIELTGGIFDFRMDNMAFSLFGIFVACIIKSQIFLNCRWSIIAIIFAILMILMRAITLTYMISITSAMTIYLFYAFKKAQTITDKNDYKKRLHHVAIAFLMIVFVSFIYLWINKDALYNYYVVGHVISNEKQIRVAEVGIKNLYQLITYYPYTLFRYQIGPYASGIIICFIVVSLLQFIYIRRKPFSRILSVLTFKFHSIQVSIAKNSTITKEHSLTNQNIWRDSFIFLILCIILPLIILTMDTLKSPVVGGIVIMPILWLVIWLHVFLTQKINAGTNILYYIIAVLTLIAGLINLTKECVTNKRLFNYQELGMIQQMHLDIGNYAISHHWPSITMSTDRITEYLSPTDITIAYYEKYGRLLNTHSTIVGGTLFPSSKTDMINALKNSNVIVFNISNNYPAHSPYPADMQIATFKSELIDYAEKHFIHLNDYPIKQSIYRVYVRAE